MLVYLASQTLLEDGGDTEEIAYSEAKAIVEDRPQTVRNVVFHPDSKKVELELVNGGNVEAGYPSEQSALEFERTLDAQGIRYESRDSGGSAWWSLLTYLLPFVLFMGFWVFMMSRGQEKDRDGRRGESGSEPEGSDPYR